MKCYNKAVVATGHPEVSAAAAEVLKEGGNAFDAAVAAGFAGAVAESGPTSLGGGGFLLARTSGANGESEEILFDFFVDTPGLGLDNNDLEPHFFPVTIHFPGSDQDFNVGLGSVAVPANLKGYLHVHHRLGQLPLEAILKPAIRLAREGLEINASQSCFYGLLKPILTLTAEGRKLYAPEGKYLLKGDRISNPDLADFMEKLPEDKGESFYHGAIAHAIAEDMRKGQGLLTIDDLAAYEVIERSPLAVDYRGYTFLTNPFPSLGGSLIAVALSLMSEESPETVEWGSPEFALRTAARMLEVERIRKLPQNEIENHMRHFTRGTTQVSIADSYGNVASMTTSNGEGSGYIAPGTGIMLNNMMGEDDLHPQGFHASPPGQRVASMMSPSILLNDGDAKLVIGSGGSKRIRTAITQVLSSIIDYNIPIQEAVIAPRIHWDEEIMQMEPGFSEEVIAAMKKNWPVNIWQDLDLYFGGVHTVIPGDSGGGDPRRGGAVVVIE